MVLYELYFPDKFSKRACLVIILIPINDQQSVGGRQEYNASKPLSARLRQAVLTGGRSPADSRTQAFNKRLTEQLTVPPQSAKTYTPFRYAAKARKKG